MPTARSKIRIVGCPVALAVLLVLAGCGSPASLDGGAEGANADPERIAADLLSAMDTTANPCEDFYRYACGGWLDGTELPGDESRWARSFSEIERRNREALRDLLEEIRVEPAPERAKLGAFYQACMDGEAIDRAGVERIRPMLDRIEEVDDSETFMQIVGEMHGALVQALFSTSVSGDLKNPDINLANLFQGGLGLPDRDYYLDESRAEIVDDYRGHIATMLALSGMEVDEATRMAKEIVRFETELARASRTRTEMRDVERLYNKIDLDGLQRLTPGLDWEPFFRAIGHADLGEFNVGTPEFFETMATRVASSHPDLLRAYLRWNLVHALAEQLPTAFIDEDFRFFGNLLRGQAEIRPRWRRCIEATDAAMGELLGEAFVERQFAGDSKPIALQMIQGIEHAFEAGLPDLDWMDERTRKIAAEKMGAVANKIGYPDRWRDYSDLRIQPDDFLGNTIRANQFEFRRQIAKVGKPVDRSEWNMTPPTVNAYYNPQFNEMVFPAGVLQQPFFHPGLPPAMNYGGIGMVMGHELTHGFDDTGRRFDASGKMTQWWDDSAIEAFTERTECVADLYSGYEVQPGHPVNGKLTLGENIADLGGIKLAYAAYRDEVEARGESDPFVGELTNDQLFFVAFAQTWCMLTTDETERMLLTVDTHSPARYRVVGPVSNMPEFAQAFSCPAGSPMNPVEKCEVW